jgi:hypothetical protein
MRDKGLTLSIRFSAIDGVVGGAVALLAPESMGKLGRWFADNPRYMRLAGVVHISLGLLLLQGWHRPQEPPRMWWRRLFGS